MTWQPSAASARAAAKPKPEVAPVTMQMDLLMLECWLRDRRHRGQDGDEERESEGKRSWKQEQRRESVQSTAILQNCWEKISLIADTSAAISGRSLIFLCHDSRKQGQFLVLTWRSLTPYINGEILSAHHFPLSDFFFLFLKACLFLSKHRFREAFRGDSQGNLAKDKYEYSSDLE